MTINPVPTRTYRFWSWSNFVLCSIVAVVSYRYVIGVGPVPPIIFGNALKSPWLVIHAAGAATALLISPVQLVASVRRRFPSIHRWLGRLYVVGCTVGGIAGIPLALGSSAGWVATTGFGTLDIAWLVTTLSGWRAGRRKQFGDHRRWMVRSFALTYAAVTLRIYLVVLAVLPLSFLMSGYRIISFLCWVPNLLAAELLLRRATRKSAEPRSTASAPRTYAGTR